MFAAILQWMGALLFKLRWLIVTILAIGLPLYIYLACIAKEPIFSPEQDVELGRPRQRHRPYGRRARMQHRAGRCPGVGGLSGQSSS